MPLRRWLFPCWVATLCLSFAGCEQKELEINHFLAPCVGVDVQACLVVREDPAQDWTWDYSGIRGFSWEWGHSYQVRVRLDHAAHPQADAPSITETLVDVLSDQPVAEGTPFSIALYAPDFFGALEKTGAQYKLLGERLIDCAAPVCQALDAALLGRGPVTLDLHHPQRPDLPLVLDRVH